MNQSKTMLNKSRASTNRNIYDEMSQGGQDQAMLDILGDALANMPDLSD